MPEKINAWAIFVAIISALWVMILYIRDRRLKLTDLSTAVVARLLDGDKLDIEHPEIQEYLSRRGFFPAASSPKGIRFL